MDTADWNAKSYDVDDEVSLQLVELKIYFNWIQLKRNSFKPKEEKNWGQIKGTYYST